MVSVTRSSELMQGNRLNEGVGSGAAENLIR
jgi:hypothetical protein